VEYSDLLNIVKQNNWDFEKTKEELRKKINLDGYSMRETALILSILYR